MFLIFFLSSQDGEQTAKLSLAISEFLSRFGGGGTEEVAQTHMGIRKLAHIVLFFWLGAIFYLLVFYGVLPEAMRWKRGISMLAAFVIAAGYGYFDEWHKQFIVGRHFQIEEAELNIISGCIGIVVVGIVQFL